MREARFHKNGGLRFFADRGGRVSRRFCHVASLHTVASIHPSYPKSGFWKKRRQGGEEEGGRRRGLSADFQTSVYLERGL